MPGNPETFASVNFSGGNSVDNAIGCTNNVNATGYHFGGENIGGNPNVVSGGTDPTSINFDGGATSNPLSNMNGGGKRKARRSRKLKRSNKSRLNSKSKKSRSKSIRKSKKVRKTLSKRRVSLKRKSNKKRSRKSLK